MKSASWAEIDLAAIRHNVQQIQQFTRQHVIAVVKANAYGHGMLEVSHAIADLVDMFAVATLDEALLLAEALPQRPVLCLFPSLAENADAVVRHGIHQIVHTEAYLQALSEAAQRWLQPALVHIKVDTGMHRVGIPHSQAVAFVHKAFNSPGVRVEGLSTHLACADDLDSGYTSLQLERFHSVLELLPSPPPWIHAANSAGVLHWSRSHFNAVRPGLLLYGLCPTLQEPLPFEPHPALTWKSRIIQVRRVAEGQPIGYGGTHRAAQATTVATIPVGYADGYRRALSNRAPMFVQGQPAPVLGRVCMDQTMCDVSGIEGVATGDDVVLLGPQIPAEEHARLADTIHYDILCGISPRVQRIYRGGPEPV